MLVSWGKLLPGTYTHDSKQQSHTKCAERKNSLNGPVNSTGQDYAQLLSNYLLFFKCKIGLRGLFVSNTRTLTSLNVLFTDTWLAPTGQKLDFGTWFQSQNSMSFSILVDVIVSDLCHV